MDIKRANNMDPEETVSNLDATDVASPLQSVVKDMVKQILSI